MKMKKSKKGFYGVFDGDNLVQKFSSEAQATAYINGTPTEKRTQNKRAIENIHDVKVGDVFYTSWGYEQTNIDFFKVVVVTAKMATVKPIKSRCEETHWCQGKAKPLKGAYYTNNGFYAETIKTKTDAWDGEPRLKNADGDEHRGYLYKGEAINFSSYA